jgi:putative SOS response-associated peptidase YedK
MCHHYKGSRNPPAHLADEFSVRSNHYQLEFPEFPPGGFYPLKRVPIIRYDQAGEREMVAAEWGLLPFWWKPSDKTPKRSTLQRKCFNARSEDVDTKPSFREAFKRRRCLLPAGAFFEKGHYFRFTDDRPFAFAGLWETWKGGDDEIVESCTLLTTEPNDLVSSVGHHRMPVLLSSEDEYRLWLNLDAGRAAIGHLFAPTDPQLMTKYRPPHGKAD